MPPDADVFSTSAASNICSPETAADRATPLPVCLLISSLEFGGAERQVLEMIRTFDRRRVRPIVCSLSENVPLAASLGEHRADLRIVPKSGRFDVTTVFRVASLLRRERIRLVHAFLFDAEIVARLAAPIAGVEAVVSSERNANYTRPRLHRAALALTRRLSRAMVANSHAGKQFNIRTQGLDPRRIAVVHNGVDVERFAPSPTDGQRLRAQLGIAADAPVVGMIASYKPQKAHDNFLRMAVEVRAAVPAARFLIVGGLEGGSEESRRYRDGVRRLCVSLRLEDSCVFLDNQDDMASVYNACDATALLSRREGTPNVVLESMACGVPVVASDIADNALLVAHGNSGFIVPVDDYRAAAAHLITLLSERAQRRRMAHASRATAVTQYSLEQTSRKLEEVYRRCLVGAFVA